MATPRRKPEIGRATRTVTLRTEDVDADDATLRLSFSSEEPVDRGYMIEILDHGEGAVRMGRLKDGAPLLVNHDPDRQVGVVEEAMLDGAARKGRAVVRFGSGALAREILADVRDGIRRNVSVGYWIHAYRLESSEGDVETYRVTDWEPLEISIVAVPADPSVGVGRSIPRAAVTPIHEETEMNTNETTAAEAAAKAPAAIVANGEDAAKARAAERARIREIEAIGREHRLPRELVEKGIEQGVDGGEFGRWALNAIAGRDKPLDIRPMGDLGLTAAEKQRFSIMRAIRAAISNDWSGAGFEREVSQAAAKRMNRNLGGGAFMLPTDVLMAGVARRDLTSGGAATGAELVADNFDAAAFIDLLYNRMMVKRLGATVLSGLVGDVVIPKITAGSTAAWISTETGASSESTPATAQVTMTPKSAATYVEVSRQLLQQSTPSAEQMVRNDLLMQTALLIDAGAINGSGSSGQPTGILNAGSLDVVAIGTNGGAPTWTHVVSLETQVAIDNADIGAVAYLTNAQVRGKLKQTEKASATGMFVWQDGAAEPGFGLLNGYRAGVSQQVPSNLTKGTSSGICSAIIFGNWNDLVIGEWGGIEILVNPYALDTTRLVRISVFAFADVAIKRIASFSAVKDALTT